jgi:O-antigen/teichoic acid export membrane protein
LSVTDVPWLLTDGLGGQLFLSLIYIGLVFWVGEFFHVPSSVKTYTLALFPLSFFSIFTIAVRARSQMALYSIAQLLMAVLQFFAVLVLWAARGGIHLLIVSLLIAHVLVALWASGYVPIRLEFLSPMRFFSLLRECSSMALIGTLRLVYEKMPVVLLPVFSSYSTTGIFSVASRLTDAGKLGHFSAFAALYPEMAKDEKFGRQRTGLRALSVSAFLISLLLFIFADLFLKFLFGNEFISAAPALRVLIWIVPVYVLVTYMSLGLVAMGRERLVLNPLLIALAVLILLVAFNIKLYGVVGVAWAVLFAEVVHAFLLWRQWRRHVVPELS